MSDFFQKVPVKDEHLYFKENMIRMLHAAVQQQIVANEVKNLANGQGIFILEELTTKERGLFHIAVHAHWKYDTANKQFQNFDVSTYYLFSGDMPDALLDEINNLQAQGPAEWR